MKKIIIVTGGAGFIGSHVVEALVNLGNKVLVVDNLSSGKEENLSAVMQDIEFIQQSVENFNFDNYKNIAAVIHLAAQTSVPFSIKSFKDSSVINMNGTISVVDFCRRNQIPLVYATSSAVYGGLAFGDDASSDIELISPYAVDKYAMELYARCAHELYGLSSIGLRFFNVYGPRQDPANPYSGVITIFINQLLKHQPILVYGGHQTRDFVYVEDVVKCIIKSLSIVLENNMCEVVNVLTGKSISINQLLQVLSQRLRVQPEVRYVELPKGDPVESGGSTGKISAILDVCSDDFIKLFNGLEKTIQFFYQGIEEVIA